MILRGNDLRTEDEIQIAFFNQLQIETAFGRFTDEQTRWIFHVPNGGHRDGREGAKFQRMGVKAGVSDICVPYPSKTFSGAFLELKSMKPSAVPSGNQLRFLLDMQERGYFVAIVHNEIMAVDLLDWYFNKGVKFPLPTNKWSVDGSDQMIGAYKPEVAKWREWI